MADLKNQVTIGIPHNSEFLTLQMQRGIPCLWFEVDPDTPEEMRTFHVIGTGHTVPEGIALEYVGTVQAFDETLVLHVYEQPRYETGPHAPASPCSPSPPEAPQGTPNHGEETRTEARTQGHQGTEEAQDAEG
jgi:hypothetical protein